MTYTITFPAQARDLPRFKPTHATLEAATAEVRRVRSAYARSGGNTGLAMPTIHDEAGKQHGVNL